MASSVVVYGNVEAAYLLDASRLLKPVVVDSLVLIAARVNFFQRPLSASMVRAGHHWVTLREMLFSKHRRI